MNRHIMIGICLSCLPWAVGANDIQAQLQATPAQDKVSTEVIDGVTYDVVRRPVTTYVPVVEHQSKQETFYRPQVSTQYQTHNQTYLTPITEYKLVPRLVGRWNPFVQPYWTYEYAPVTRWEARPTTVQVPLTKTDMIPETRTTQVPVTTYKPHQEWKVVQMTKKSGTPGQPATAIASQPTNDGWKPGGTGYGGQQQLLSDPPAKGRYEPTTTQPLQPSRY